MELFKDFYPLMTSIAELMSRFWLAAVFTALASYILGRTFPRLLYFVFFLAVIVVMGGAILQHVGATDAEMYRVLLLTVTIPLIMGIAWAWVRGSHGI